MRVASGSNPVEIDFFACFLQILFCCLPLKILGVGLFSLANSHFFLNFRPISKPIALRALRISINKPIAHATQLGFAGFP